MIEGSKSGETVILPRYGMVGGGNGAFIGDVHRKAVGLDGKAQLVAGCFSRDKDNTLATGRSLGLDESRLYADYQEMAKAEAARGDGIDFVSIVTPNFTHYPVAKAFLEQGIHVVCDKPLTIEVEEAENLARIAKEKDLLFCVTYTYTGYPMVKHAREMIQKGDLGEIRFVNVEYTQDWLASKTEDSGNKQAAWRTDPKRAGKSNCVGDIGSHAENLAAYITGLKIKSLCARLDTFVGGRVLDDNASIMVAYEGGAKGLYWTSQIAVGCDNALRIRVYGSKASLEWSQENPNYLTVHYLDKPSEILSRGRSELYPMGQSLVRIPSGHPEGYFEAFANIYAAFIAAVASKKQGQAPAPDAMDYPTAEEGIDGVKFIGKCVESSQKGALWVEF